MRFVIPVDKLSPRAPRAALQYVLKAAPAARVAADDLEDADGLLTPLARSIAAAYAARWVAGERDLDAERAYPALSGLLADIRASSALARDFLAP